MSYLVNLAIEGKPVVVIGGGEIAARKVRDLLAAQARVTVVTKAACSEILDLAEVEKITLHLRAYADGDLAGAFVAIAATNDEALNASVAADAERLRVMINVVDRPPLCTFTVPATVKRGDLTIAIATQGRSPALSGILREELEQQYGPEYGRLVEVFGDLRRRMMELGWNGMAIRQTLAKIYRGGVVERIKEGDEERLRDFLEERLRGSE